MKIFALVALCLSALSQPLQAEAKTVAVTFLAEMEALPEEENPAFLSDACRLPAGWSKTWWSVYTSTIRQINTAKVKEISGWAKEEMEEFVFHPRAAKPKAYSCDADSVLAEVVLQKLPSHSPLVTRELRAYVLYPKTSSFPESVTVTIRGELQE